MNGTLYRAPISNNVPDGGIFLNEKTGYRVCIIGSSMVGQFSLIDSLKFESISDYYAYLNFDISLPKILSYISKITMIPAEDILSKSRRYEFVRARRLFLTLAAKIYGYGHYTEIGNFLGGKHCDTIHHMKTIGGEYKSKYKGTNLIIDQICEDWLMDVGTFITYSPNGDSWLKWRRLQLLAAN